MKYDEHINNAKTFEQNKGFLLTNMNIHKRYIIIVLFTILSLNISAQRLHREEVLWVLLHPFAAIKVVPMFKELKEMKSQFLNHPQVDGLNAGGSSDALRHIYWMARMSQKIKVNKALKLGIAHEKANERYFEMEKIFRKILW